jgi:Zn-dependent peptidase ImmA (M78 family)
VRREIGLRQARRAAQAFLHQFGVRDPEHIDLELFAGALGVRITAGCLDSARARLIHGPTPVVRISDKLTHPGARRFSLAHELAHLVLKHEPTVVGELCAATPDRRRDRDPDVRDPEAEADTFAAEMLMPTALVQPRCEVSPVNLHVAHAIERDFRVSLAAAALRVAELSSEAVASVYSKRGEVRWARSSASLPWQIARGRRLGRTSVAIDYFRKGAIDPRAQPIPIDAWFDRDTDLDLIEHSVAIPDLGGVLTLLWIPQDIAERTGLSEERPADDLSARQWRDVVEAELEAAFAEK